MRRFIRAAALLWPVRAVLLLPAVEVRANDSTFGGIASQLVPLEETRVQMVSESIVIEETRDGGHWSIEATYRFRNHTSEPVALQVGFPERGCFEEEDCADGPWTFRNLRTTVRGREVRHRIGQVSRTAHPWAPVLGRVHLFDFRFAPGENVEVVHRYQMGKSMGVDSGDLVHCVTRTGALWNGPIEEAKFTIRTRTRPWRVSFPAEYQLERYAELPSESGGAFTELILVARSWVPKADLELYLAPRVVAFEKLDWLSTCPNPDAVVYALDDRLRSARGGDEDAIRRAYAAEVFGALSSFVLRRCRNMVFAAHGHAFRNEANRRFFYRPAQTTRQPLESPDSGHEGHWTLFHFRQNPSNPAPGRAALDETERSYVMLVRLVESGRGSEK